MSTGKIQVYYGEGRGKTSAALGYAIHEASKGESVIVIQFLKQKDEDEISFLGRLEPATVAASSPILRATFNAIAS